MEHIEGMERRFVAFIDILGFKQLVKENKAKKIIDIWHERNNLIKEDSSMVFGAPCYDNITLFSDCIVISIKESSENLEKILGYVQSIQVEMLRGGILIRGGLTVGFIHHDDDKVYGEGMVKAYELESKNSVTPRILIDDEIEKEYEEYIRSAHKYLKRDSDGHLIIDYVQRYLFFYTMMLNGEHEKEIGVDFKKLITDNLKNKDIRVIQKYLWLKEYYNEYLKIFKGAIISEKSYGFYKSLLIE